MKILILEDNLPFAECITDTIQELGFTADHTTSVDESIKLFENHSYDAVITDVHLVNMNSIRSSGFDLVRHIRVKLKSAAVIAMTTGLELLSSDEVKESGVDIFHYKPLTITLEQFISDIHKLVLDKKN